jgi:DNA-binding transcriptional LysR family regulator
MKDISSKQLRRLDLTLLMVLDGVLRHRKLTTVAQELNLTQPAISHAVTRLRDILGDPLFVRRANGVQPTPRALALAQPVAQALATLRDALQQGRHFDPGSANREFRIAALDYAIAMLLPDFLARFSIVAPGCRLAFRTMGYEAGRVALANGAIDMILGLPAPTGPFLQRTLMAEDFVVLARAGHPVIERKLDLACYLKCGHLLVSAAGDTRGSVDNALAKVGKERRVVAALPQFLAGFAAVAGSDMITTAPRRLARRHAAAYGLRQFEVPFPLPGFEVATLRHENTAQDAGLNWLDDELAQALSKVR